MLQAVPFPAWGCAFVGSSGKLAEPNVPGQCEGSLAGDAPWSLCKVGARCWGCPGGGPLKRGRGGEGCPALRGAVWGLYRCGSGAVGSGVTAVG